MSGAETRTIPIVVGVTGHRDLRPEDEAALFEAVRGHLTELKSRYPNSPVKVLSALAEGADQLCARAALEVGCDLIVPLPMERERYTQNFDERSKSGFEDLIALAESSFVVPAEEPVPPGARSIEEENGFFYRQAGIYVAMHSHILLALWDGREILFPEGGGTFETVDFMLRESWDHNRRGARGNAFFKPPQDGTVWQILTPRAQGPVPAGELFGLTVLANGADAIQWPPALGWTEQYNSDLAHRAEAVEAHGADAASDLLGEGAPALPVHIEGLVERFCAADCLSLLNRDMRLRTLRWLSGLGTLLVLVFLLYDEMESDLMLPLYALLLVAMFVVYRRAKAGGYHEKYVQYRLLAEALRVQIYWELCGVDARVWDQYTWAQKNDVVWVKEALAALDVASCGREIAPLPGGIALLRGHWVGGQLRYHRSARGSKQKRIARNAGISSALLWATVGMFVLVFVLEFFFKRAMLVPLPTGPVEGLLMMHEGQEITVRGLFKILLGIVAAGTALLSNYFSKLSLVPQARDNERMANLYEMAGARLDALRSDQLEEQRLILFHLGRESVVENGGWLLDYLEQAPDIIL